MKIWSLLVAGILVTASLADLRAAVIFTPGNHPEPNEENVLLGSNPAGSFLTGYTNVSAAGVRFTSSTDLLASSAHGQADVEADDGRLESITIALSDGGGFTDLIINPFLGNKMEEGAATVTVVANDGTFTYRYPSGLEKGANYLTITAAPGETITSTTIAAEHGFLDLRQTRISSITAGGGVPEPGTMLLLAGGLLVLGSRRLRIF